MPGERRQDDKASVGGRFGVTDESKGPFGVDGSEDEREVDHTVVVYVTRVDELGNRSDHLLIIE